MTSELTILVMAKAPLPGRVKTRLTPPFTPDEAAALAAAALADTLQVALAAPARRRVVVLDGAPGDWLPAGFDVLPQVRGGLDERIAAALDTVTGAVLLVGMDTPQMTVSQLTVSFAAHDAWFGPAEDGGFWALGLARSDPTLVRGVPMSRDCTGAVQVGRLVDAGLRVGMLPRLRDVDTAACAVEVAALAPHTRFAALHTRFTAGAVRA
ncbi:MAG TPA: DUF2064 domain-containing protein [Sporichthyaceae bacterium]|jgi:hypothetical protein